MDTDRAIAILEWWVKNAQAAQVVYQGIRRPYAISTSREVQVLRDKEDQTRRVIAGALGMSALPSLFALTSQRHAVDLQPGIDLAASTIGRLRTDAETRAIVGSTAPTMAADALHATIWGAASTLWDGEHYGQAVQRAATFLNADIQDKIDRRDISDSALMQEAFSLSDPVDGKARIRWPGEDTDLSVRAMRVGILNFSQGVFSGIRNLTTHSTDDLPRQDALEQLAALSVLARWIDGCEVLRSGG